MPQSDLLIRYERLITLNSVDDRLTKVKQLLSEGLDINAVVGRDVDALFLLHGRVAWYYALLKGRWELVESLLGHGANVTVADEHGGALTAALDFRIDNPTPKEIIQLLIMKGADVNQCDKSGTSPLMLAVMSEDLEIVKLLLENGADISLRNKFKEDVLVCAKSCDKPEVLKFIKQIIKSGGKSDSRKAVLKFFRPKTGTEAEYTFYPTKKFMAEHDSDESDVGYFLNDKEILVLEPVKEPAKGNYSDLSFPVAEGKVSIRLEEWDEVSEDTAKSLKAKGTVEYHDIDCIIGEYLKD